MPKKNILVLNAGSSSLKFCLYNSKLQEITSGAVSGIGQSRPEFFYFSKGKKNNTDLAKSIKNHRQALQILLFFLQWQDIDLNTIGKVGHRVVHGGWIYSKPVKINNQVIKKLKPLNWLAPLHNPINLEVIADSRRIFSHSQHFASFDTAWYKNLSVEQYTYALPAKYLHKEHIRKYGFHGLSHEYIARQAAVVLKKPLKKLNLITCHLGSGSSITAVKKGLASNTSMGFTPLSGLSMAARSGDLDANIPLYLIAKMGQKTSEVYQLLNQQSGWKALCGTADFKQIMVDAGFKIEKLKPRAKDKRKLSKLVLHKFIEEVSFYINGYAGFLGKVDAIILSGAIGENRDFKKLLSPHLLPKAKVLMLPTNEELMIAQQIKNI